MNIGFHTNKKNINKLSKKYNAFQIFLTNPRSSYKSKITDDEILEYKKMILKNNIYLIGHFRYTFNLGQNNPNLINVASNDIDIISNMGGSGVVFHTGNHLKLSIIESEDIMYNNIIKIIDNLTTNGKFILETSAGEGTSILTTLETLSKFYNRFNNNYKKKIKFCIDTCHIFAAGYDISTYDNMIKYILDFHNKIGWNNLDVIHLNDSKSICNSKKDRHENIEFGEIWNKNNKSLIILLQIAKLTNKSIIFETPDIKTNNYINVDKVINYTNINISNDITNIINLLNN